MYAEMQRHLIRDEESRNQHVEEIARRWNLPLIATNGVRFACKRKRDLMDVLTCTRHKTAIDEAGCLLERNAERYLKSDAAMRRLFAATPRVLDAAAELSDRLQFTLADLGYEFPRYPVGPGETMDSVLRARTMQGALERYGAHHSKPIVRLSASLH